MRKILLSAMFCLLLVGCGITQEEHDKEEKERKEDIQESLNLEEGEKILEESKEILEETSAIDGFLYASANYEKYNSYASENGLGDTKIYVEGKVLNTEETITEDMPIINLIVEQKDGNRWCVGVAYVDDLEDIVGKEIRAFGTYQGFSDKFKVPAMVALDNEQKAKIQVKNENGSYETIWSFQDYLLEYLKEQENVQEKNDENEKENYNEYTPTMGEKNALKKAKSYLEIMSFSYNGLIEQLEYEKFSHEEAIYGADNCGADWNEQAVKKAKSYLDMMAFSKDSLIEQLEYEGFTYEQAVYGVEKNGY